MIRRLYDSFLSRALSEYSNQIEVVVCDNSDYENACLNQVILGNTVNYYKNNINLGFGGNLVRCAEQATGEFIWTISDDDFIKWDGFKDLMDYLSDPKNDGKGCIMLPYYTHDIFGGYLTHNDHKDWGIEGNIDIKTFLSNIDRLPFVLFSSVVVRLDKSKLRWISEKFSGNFLMQIPLFLSMLKNESQIHFLDTCVIELFQGAQDGDWPLVSMYKYKLDVFSFLKSEYNIEVETLKNHGYKEMLLCILSHRAGMNYIPDADKARWPLLADLRQHLNLKAICLAFALIIPKFLFRQPYIIYFSLVDAHASSNHSILAFISRFIHHFIRTQKVKVHN